MKNTDEQLIKEIREKWFVGRTAVYIDYANLVGTQGKIGWHVEVSRLKSFFSLFPQVGKIKFYYGQLESEVNSKLFLEQVRTLGFDVITKPVKIIRKSIDVSGTDLESPAVLYNFIRSTFIRILDVETIAFLNSKLADLNRSGKLYLQDRKCNFDVEIGVDLLLDAPKYDCVVLMSGDSDFADIIKRVIALGKTVIVFAPGGTIAFELTKIGVKIFDLKKIRDYICWRKERRI